jgi:type I restriction enzyme S subunit
VTWRTVKIGDICLVKRGTTITEKQAIKGSIPVVAGGISYSYKHNQANRPANVITVSASGANAGYVNFWNIPIFASDCSTVEAVGNNIDIRFIFYFLRSKQDFINQTMRSGAAQPHVYAKDIAQISLNLPPLTEQKRISTILDKAEEIKAKREQAIVKLDELADNTFVHLFEKNKKYEYQKLSNLCDLITDGTHYTPIYSNEGVVFLSAKNVTSGKVDWVNIKHIPQSLHIELEKRVKPKIGDVLLAKNGTTGVAAIVDRDITFDIYVSLALLRPGNKITTEFLHASLNSKITKRQFNSALKGIGVPNLHLVDIRNTTIPLPNLEEQGAFLKIIQKINVNRELEVRSLKSINNLINSLQNQAFTTGFNA